MILAVSRTAAALRDLYCGSLVAIGIAWVAGVPELLRTTWLDGQVLPLCIGLGTAAALLKAPYRKEAGLLEILLGLVAIMCWTWSTINYDAWLVTFAERSVAQWMPGLAALLLTLEAMRKTCGLAVTLLVWTFIAYALLGDALGGFAAAAPQSTSALVLYLYADSQGVPGFIVRVVVTLVLAFVVLGKLMEQSGATQFFTDLAMRLMAHRRGGAAKVSVVASAAFGMVSGSTVGNVMSTGLVTIPLMKRSGFPAPIAAAVEAVASNGGQLAPPVMGATAFLIAEFLQISYREVVVAAAVPALLYFVVVFAQIDAIAKRLGLEGTAEREGPSVGEICRRNWPLLLPIVGLLVLLLVLELNAARAALAAAGLLLVLLAIKDPRVLAPRRLGNMLRGSGENLLPILLIGAGAGVVIGVLSSSGLGFQLSIALAELGENLGLFAMLLMTALLSIVLGMGMPTAAVYLVLSVVLAPSLVGLGVRPLAAHLFLFYFGVLSMLTPPIAVASFVAAGLAETGFWRTSVAALKLAAVAYLIPFLWIYNPAVILDGTPQGIVVALVLAGVAGIVLARGLAAATTNRVLGIAQVLGALVLGLVIALVA
jgi:TRAP transporter 4TM/12TM fusion protein